MEITASTTAKFDSGHVVKSILACTRQHGHFYEVTATVTGELDPELGWPRGTENLPRDVWDFAKELQGRNLNEMLPGVVTTPVGIALSFMERLALTYRTLSAVEVRCSDGTSGRVTRQPR
ncbi:MAG TPA: 6-carboxytetrahydropterin synthase [Candidatus Limnocylindrales bacterium]|nr:6-carboxytetrahydropterin synthase [Candidatus Limnocylindrales bacterium]